MANIYNELLNMYNSGNLEELGEMLKLYAKEELDKSVGKTGTFKQAGRIVKSMMKEWAKNRNIHLADCGLIECQVDNQTMYAALTPYRVFASTYDFGERHIVPGELGYFAIENILCGTNNYASVVVDNKLKTFLTENKSYAKEKIPVAIYFKDYDTTLYINPKYVLEAYTFCRSNELTMMFNISGDIINTPVHFVTDYCHCVILPINPNHSITTTCKVQIFEI